MRIKISHLEGAILSSIRSWREQNQEGRKLLDAPTLEVPRERSEEQNDAAGGRRDHGEEDSAAKLPRGAAGLPSLHQDEFEEDFYVECSLFAGTPVARRVSIVQGEPR